MFFSVTAPFMALFNNLVLYDQTKPSIKTFEQHVPELTHRLVVECRQHRADLQAAPGREVARRQAVHGLRLAVRLRMFCSASAVIGAAQRNVHGGW